MERFAEDWIPVSEKAHADHGGPVLITWQFKDDPTHSGPFVMSARFDCGKWDHGTPAANANRDSIQVQAWREMPKPYVPTAAKHD